VNIPYFGLLEYIVTLICFLIIIAFLLDTTYIISFFYELVILFNVMYMGEVANEQNEIKLVVDILNIYNIYFLESAVVLLFMFRIFWFSRSVHC